MSNSGRNCKSTALDDANAIVYGDDRRGGGVDPQDGNMLKHWVALVGLIALGSSPAQAGVDCTPHCDFVHDYGPYDFTYERPPTYGFPRCGPSGNCSPYLAYYGYVYPRTRIVIRPRPRR
jgi:hypothetical protein